MIGMSTPASAGPRSAASAEPPSIRLFAWVIVRSSSPTSSGRIVRCEAKYGGMKQPRSATRARRSPKLRTPAAYNSGIAARSGARAASESNIVVAGTEPLNQRPARDAEQRHRHELRREDERHLPRRPGRDQHEPGQREVGHPRAEDRDDLGADERAHGPLVHLDAVHAQQYKTSVRFCKVRSADAEDLRREKAERREQILTAARRCFAEYGYEGATVARLEQETGLSRGAIFNYFGSKEDLFIELAVQDTKRLSDIWVNEGLTSVVREVFELDPAWLGVEVELIRRVRTDRDFRDRIEQRMQAVVPVNRARILEAQRSGELRSDVGPEEIGAFVNLVLNGIALLRASGEKPPSSELVLSLLNDARRRPAGSRHGRAHRRLTLVADLRGRSSPGVHAPAAVGEVQEPDRQPDARRGRVLRQEEVVGLVDERQRHLDRLRRHLRAEAVTVCTATIPSSRATTSMERPRTLVGRPDTAARRTRAAARAA